MQSLKHPVNSELLLLLVSIAWTFAVFCEVPPPSIWHGGRVTLDPQTAHEIGLIYSGSFWLKNFLQNRSGTGAKRLGGGIRGRGSFMGEGRKPEWFPWHVMAELCENKDITKLLTTRVFPDSSLSHSVTPSIRPACAKRREEIPLKPFVRLNLPARALQDLKTRRVLRQWYLGHIRGVFGGGGRISCPTGNASAKISPLNLWVEGSYMGGRGRQFTK